MRSRPMIIALSYVVALASEWALRRAIHGWAPIERPPFNLAFWSEHHFLTTLLVVTIAAVGAPCVAGAAMTALPR